MVKARKWAGADNTRDLSRQRTKSVVQENTRKVWASKSRWSFETPPAGLENIRQRPTLPRGFPRSTISSGGLNYRVRDGNGCDPSDIATGNPLARALLTSATRCTRREKSLSDQEGDSNRARVVFLKRAYLDLDLEPRTPRHTGHA